MRMAFKEWGVVVDALGSGEQIVVLRKGGIAEGREGFQVEHEKFWLFPTRFHQQAEGVVESAQIRFSGLDWPEESMVRVEYFAEVKAVEKLESLTVAERLRGQHIWRDEVIADRFDWGQDEGIYAIAVRVSRLAEPVELPMIPAYGGCKSWVQLQSELPLAKNPVLNEKEFEGKLAAFRTALTGEFVR